MAHNTPEELAKWIADHSLDATAISIKTLGDGYSGANVLQLVLDGDRFRGRYVLKIGQGTADEKTRYDHLFGSRRNLATRLAKVEVAGVCRMDEERPVEYALYQLAGATEAVSRIKRLDEVDDFRLHLIAGTVGRDLSDSSYYGRPVRSTVGELLKGWLTPAKLDPASRAGSRMFGRSGLFRHGRTSCEYFGRRLVDPLALYFDPDVSGTIISAERTVLHNDLHLRNVIVEDWPNEPLSIEEGKEFPYWLIDYGKTKSGAAYFDEAYMQVAILCQKAPTTGVKLDDFRYILLGQDPYRYPNASLLGVGLAIAESNKAVGGSLKGNAASPERSTQWLLAKVAAGLNWLNKDFERDALEISRRVHAYAAIAATELLNSHSEGLRELGQELAYDRRRATIPSATSDTAVSTEGTPVSSDEQKLLASYLLLLNAWIRGVGWKSMESLENAQILESLLYGLPLSEDVNGDSESPFVRLEQYVKETQVIEVTGRLRNFLEVRGGNVDALQARLEFVGEVDSAANRELRALINEKIWFLRHDWVSDDVKWQLAGAHDREDCGYKALRKAYFQAGTRLSAAEMAAAAIADFGSHRWAAVAASPNRALPHLRMANEHIGERIAAMLKDRPGQRTQTVHLAEGGSGGCHTVFHILKSIDECDKISSPIHVKYLGMELVPLLAARGDAMIGGMVDNDDARSRLFRNWRQESRLSALRDDGRFVDAVSMEAGLSSLWRILPHSENDDAQLDAFVASFAFHHVPNGEAVKSFFSNDALSEFSEAYTLYNHPKQSEIGTEIIRQLRKLKQTYEKSSKESVEALRDELMEVRRGAIASARELQVPEAGAFVGLADASMLSDASIESLEEMLVQRRSVPRRTLAELLANPQRDALLTARSLLKDGGLVAIADPDGFSRFNAQHASSDPELTVANFQSEGDLREVFYDLGFSDIESYSFFSRDGRDFESIGYGDKKREGFGYGDNYGYVVFGRRSKSRERERSVSTSRGGRIPTDPKQEDLCERTKTRVGEVGKLLRDNDPAIKNLIEAVFSGPDPIRHSRAIADRSPRAKRLLMDLGWLVALDSGDLIATKRLHRFDVSLESGGASRAVTVATDFPETPQEHRADAERVFSYSDEALAVLPSLTDALRGTSVVPSKGAVLDLFCGAGTIGLIAAALRNDVSVYFADAQERAQAQVKINLHLNGHAERLRARVNLVRVVNCGNRNDIWGNRELSRRQYDLVVADPPFSLRPDWSDAKRRFDHGGQFGDDWTVATINGAASRLKPNGRLIVVAYTLVREDGSMRIADCLKHSGLEGSFRAIETDRVFRYRHDKIADNHGRGMPLRNMMLRLGDPNKPECVIYESTEIQRNTFCKYDAWIGRLLRDEDGADGFTSLQYVLGVFTKK